MIRNVEKRHVCNFMRPLRTAWKGSKHAPLACMFPGTLPKKNVPRWAAYAKKTYKITRSERKAVAPHWATQARHLYSYSLSQPYNPTIQNRRNSVISRKATLPIECRPDQSAEGMGNLFACTQKIQWPYPIRDMVHTHGMDGLLRKRCWGTRRWLRAVSEWCLDGLNPKAAWYWSCQTQGWDPGRRRIIRIPWTAKNHSNTAKKIDADGKSTFNVVRSAACKSANTQDRKNPSSSVSLRWSEN